MRKYIFTHLVLFLSTLLFCNWNRVQAQCTDGLGKIAFTGYQIADNNKPQGQEDQFSFILLDSLPANTQIYFTDLGLVSPTAFQDLKQAKTDGVLVWTSVIGLGAGSQVVIKVSSETANLGSVSKGDGNFEFGLGGDQLFACMGSLSPAKIEAALLINKPSWDTSVLTLSSSMSVMPIVDSSKKQVRIVSNHTEDAYQASWENSPALSGTRLDNIQMVNSQLFGVFTSLSVDQAKLSQKNYPWNPSAPTKGEITLSNNLLSIVSDACYYQWQISRDGLTFMDIESNAQGATLNIASNPTTVTWYRVRLTGLKSIFSDPFYLGPPNVAPRIENLDGDSVSYTERALAVLLDLGSDATVTDTDSDDFNKGSLTVSIVSNLSANEDVLSIRNQGTEAGQIGVTSNTITYGGLPIGSFTGGVNGADLFISFNDKANPEVAQALIRNIQYHNSNNANPNSKSRSIGFKLSDGYGGVSLDAYVVVSVIAINDAPVITVPVTQNIVQDQSLTFTAANKISIEDMDANQGILRLTVTVTNGVFTLGSTAGLSSVHGEEQTAQSLTVEGNLQALNQALNGLVFTPNTGFAGSASISITCNDKGNTGQNGPMSTTANIEILVKQKPARVLHVQSINGTYKLADELFIAVAFDRSVAVTGTPFLLLNTGVVKQAVNYDSGSGTETLLFHYKVQAGDNSLALDYESTTALNLNGGTIMDAEGQNVLLNLPEVGSANSLAGRSTLVIDGQAPVFTLSINAGQNYTNTRTVQIALSSSDTDLNDLKFSNDNTNWVDVDPDLSKKYWDLSEGDGKKTVYVRYSDFAGNTTTMTASIELDMTAPKVTNVSDGEFYNTDRRIEFNEGAATLNGSAFTSGTVVTTPGSYILVVTDLAGNTTMINFTIDKTSPVVSGVVHKGIYTSNRTISFNKGTATLNGSPFTSGTIVTAEGSYSLVVTDKAGNVTIVNFRIDKTEPAMPTGLQAIGGNQQVKLSWNENTESDLAYYDIYYSSATVPKTFWKKVLSANPSPIKDMLTNAVAYTFYVQAIDSAGNKSAEATITATAKEDQSITFIAPTGLSYAMADVPLLGTATSGLTVTYRSSDETIALPYQDINDAGRWKLKILHAGTVIITAMQAGSNAYAEAPERSHSIDIAKAIMTGISLSDQVHTYDGTQKEMRITGMLPAEVKPKYTANQQTNAGVYKVTAHLDGGANYESKSLEATLTITKAIMTGISLSDQVHTYDGTLKEMRITGTLPTEVTPKYTANQQTNAGVYKVTALLDGGSNYESKSLEATLTITKANLNNLRLNNARYIYDAQVKSLQVIEGLPAGLIIRYSNNDQVNAGTYLVTAVIDESPNYNGLSLQGTLLIEKAKQTINFPALAVLRRDAGTITLDVQASSGLPVSLSLDDSMIGRLSGHNLEILRLGSLTITATQDGNTNYEAAKLVSRKIQVQADEASAIPVRVHPALSPNGDGINDFLIIEGILDYPENKVSIFDKSGKVIKVIEQYNNQDKVFTGEYVSDGTYYYYIDVKDGSQWKREKGFFVIKRVSSN